MKGRWKLRRRSVAFAAEITAHLQPDVRVRVLAQALAAHDHFVRAGNRDLREGRNNQGGGERHNADERLHVTSPCCGTLSVRLCNGGKPAGPAPAYSHMPPEPARGCEEDHTPAKKELSLPTLIGSRYDGA